MRSTFKRKNGHRPLSNGTMWPGHSTVSGSEATMGELVTFRKRTSKRNEARHIKLTSLELARMIDCESEELRTHAINMLEGNLNALGHVVKSSPHGDARNLAYGFVELMLRTSMSNRPILSAPKWYGGGFKEKPKETTETGKDSIFVRELTQTLKDHAFGILIEGPMSTEGEKHDRRR